MISASLTLSSCCVLANPIPRDSLPALEGQGSREQMISHMLRERSATLLSDWSFGDQSELFSGQLGIDCVQLGRL